MKKEYIPIYKIAGKIQYLTEVLPQIETNTILCKTLTGLGATYSEIKAKRHSVIIVPNVPPIIGKCYIDTYLQRAVNATEVSVGINNVLQGLDNKYAWFLG